MLIYIVHPHQRSQIATLNAYFFENLSDNCYVKF